MHELPATRDAEAFEAEPFDPELADGEFTVLDRGGRLHRLPGINGASLMEILRDYGLPIAATCGGAAACGTCHVYVDPSVAPKLPPPRDEEEWQLDRLLTTQANSRLACQILWDRERLDGASFSLAPQE